MKKVKRIKVKDLNLEGEELYVEIMMNLKKWLTMVEGESKFVPLTGTYYNGMQTIGQSRWNIKEGGDFYKYLRYIYNTTKNGFIKKMIGTIVKKGRVTENQLSEIGFELERNPEMFMPKIED